MDIKGPSSGHTPPAGPSRSRRAEDVREPGAPGRDAAPPAGDRDHVELSAEARELLASHLAALPEGLSASPERLREVIERVASGYYDQPDVRDEVLRHLGDALSLPPED